MNSLTTKAVASSILMAIATSALAGDPSCPELSTAQRIVGYLSWQLMAGIVGSTLVGISIFILLREFVKAVLVGFWELIRSSADVLTYLLSFGLIAAGWWAPPEYLFWPVLLGSLLFGAAVQLSIHLREIKGDSPIPVLALYCVVWSAIALFYNTSEVGFLAVAALMGLLGFSVIVTPFCYAFGFNEEKDISSGTAAALMLLAAYILGKVFFPHSTNMLKVFETGTFWLGSFVGFVGLLILSNKWYCREKRANYAWLQLVTVCCYGVGVFVGMTFGINPLAGIAGTMLVFYAAAKLIEIPVDGMTGAGLKMLLVGAVFSGAWFFLKQNEDVVTKYLTTSLPI